MLTEMPNDFPVDSLQATFPQIYSSFPADPTRQAAASFVFAMADRLERIGLIDPKFVSTTIVRPNFVLDAHPHSYERSIVTYRAILVGARQSIVIQTVGNNIHLLLCKQKLQNPQDIISSSLQLLIVLKPQKADDRIAWYCLNRRMDESPILARFCRYLLDSVLDETIYGTDPCLEFDRPKERDITRVQKIVSRTMPPKQTRSSQKPLSPAAPATAETAAATATQKPAAGAAQKPAPTLAQNAAASAAQNPAASAAQNAAASAAQNAAASAAQNPAASAAQNPAVTAAQNPAVTAARNAAASAAQNPAASATQNPAASAAQNPVTAARNAAVIAAQNPAASATQNPAATSTQACTGCQLKRIYLMLESKIIRCIEEARNAFAARKFEYVRTMCRTASGAQAKQAMIAALLDREPAPLFCHTNYCTVAAIDEKDDETAIAALMVSLNNAIDEYIEHSITALRQRDFETTDKNQVILIAKSRALETLQQFANL